ncbi:CLC_0170 family protein [Brevibacillus nitrificans]|uniref:CLC_0170 family protein n=1 Tax=Brevibacillus nitrificans TaxID=651560 RepID=UPI002635929E|nr:CLC_0170 family protein [Brevibacillus nitrificans]MED1792743.1 hypothetical protein [Brevibacillus nitrificans]
MITGGSISFSIYVIPMLLLSGVFILRVDVKRYAMPGMQKEKKASQFLGWFNLILGILLLLVNSLLQIW